MTSLEQRLIATQPLLDETWQVMANSLLKVGLEPLAVFGTAPVHAELREDTFDQSYALYAEWRSAQDTYLGSVVVNGNGQSFSEFDVLLPHPQKKQWVIEAITVWGVQGGLRTEFRLLPALES